MKGWHIQVRILLSIAAAILYSYLLSLELFMNHHSGLNEVDENHNVNVDFGQPARNE